jgi:hypothetical protein
MIRRVHPGVPQESSQQSSSSPHRNPPGDLQALLPGFLQKSCRRPPESPLGALPGVLRKSSHEYSRSLAKSPPRSPSLVLGVIARSPHENEHMRLLLFAPHAAATPWAIMALAMGYSHIATRSKKRPQDGRMFACSCFPPQSDRRFRPPIGFMRLGPSMVATR